MRNGNLKGIPDFMWYLMGASFQGFKSKKVEEDTIKAWDKGPLQITSHVIEFRRVETGFLDL